MLTGRKDAYLYAEHYDDVSGYTNPEESEHDMFNVGHTSTSISLATGLAKARDLKGDKENIIAIIGDGSMSGGEALEGLDTAGEMDTNLTIRWSSISSLRRARDTSWLRKTRKTGTGTCPLISKRVKPDRKW